MRSMNSLPGLILAIPLMTTAVPANAEIAQPGHIADKSRALDEATFVMSHNAFNHSGVLPNQRLSIAAQLARGVRGFMLDIHNHDGQLHVCHGACVAPISRVALLKTDLGTLSSWLGTHPDDVIAVHMEVADASVDNATFARFFQNNPALSSHVFNPDSDVWAGHSNWPKISELIARDQRLLLMADRSEVSGIVNAASRPYIFHDQSILVQNTYNIGDTIGQHDYDCSTRWDHLPLSARIGLKGWNRLFLMNHFHKIPELTHGDFDNRWDHIEDREIKHCKRRPTFIAVDSVDRGDVLEYVEHRNNGGVVAYEGDDATQDVVCGFSSVVSRNWSLHDGERLGCENDEMRSLKLRGMKAGQRITFYDRPDGSRDDDFGVLNIDKDIPWDDPQVVNRLELTQSSPFFRYAYSGGDGLSGKVSHIRVQPSADPGSDSAVVLLNGNNGKGGVTCTFGLAASDFWNLKDTSGCHNDDARSMRIISGRKGTVITVYDSPGGSTDDDYTVIRLKQDIHQPNDLATFEKNISDATMDVKHHHRNGLDGKVSAIRVQLP